MAHRNQKAKIPVALAAGDMVDFKDNKPFMSWLSSQLPKHITIQRASLIRSSRDMDQYYTSIRVVDIRSQKVTRYCLGVFYDGSYVPSTYPRQLASEIKRRYKFLTYIQTRNATYRSSKDHRARLTTALANYLRDRAYEET